MKINFSVGKLKIGFMSRLVILKESEQMQGYTNKCKGNNYIIMIDYDDDDHERVIDDVRFVQQQHELSDFYIFKTTKGYHAVCLDKVTWLELKYILEDSNCDSAFKFFPYTIGKKMHTLRLSKKRGKDVLFCGVVKSYFNERDKSNAHFLMLKNLFKIPITQLSNLDEETEVILSGYKR